MLSQFKFMNDIRGGFQSDGILYSRLDLDVDYVSIVVFFCTALMIVVE